MTDQAASLPTAQARYDELKTDRSPFLQRARECAALTIPSVLPPEGFSSSQQLPTPYQSLGARGSRTLASKLLLSLFPSVPFFQYKIDDLEIEKLGAKRGEIEKALSARERAVVTELDIAVFRPAAFMALLHLVVVGNVCLYVPPEKGGRCKAFRLDQYVTRRDAAGNLIEAVIQENVDFTALPEEVRMAVAKQDAHKDHVADSQAPAPVQLYTHLMWDVKSQRWIVVQEVGGIQLPGSHGKYLPDELPFRFLRFSVQPGESYGRSYVEEYLGDLDSLEALSETLVEGSAASARVVFMVRPGGTTSLKMVTDAKMGDVIPGNADDVGALQVQKQADLNVAKSQAEEIANRLAYAFLLHQSVQRSGERVTAEEIRYMASELDDGLGGVYTLLASDFQLPIIRLLEKRMEKRLKAPKLPDGVVRPVIVSGLAGIGRGHDQRNLAAFLKEVIAVLTPELALRYLNPSEFISRTAASYGIDTENLLRSAEEIEKEEQRQFLQKMIAHMGPEALKQGGGMGQQVLKQSLSSGTPPNG